MNAINTKLQAPDIEIGDMTSVKIVAKCTGVNSFTARIGAADLPDNEILLTGDRCPPNLARFLFPSLSSRCPIYVPEAR